MIRRTAVVVAALVAIATVLVGIGVGQGSPPKGTTLSASAKAAEVKGIASAGPQVKRGEELFASHGCGACHTIAAGGYKGRLGPELDAVLPGVKPAAVEKLITDPPHTFPPYQAGLMPRDFGTRLSSGDLQALAAFVSAAASAAHGKPISN
jgi:mono/diheme cytochrome c family protein